MEQSRSLRGRAEFLLRLSTAAPDEAEAARLAGLAAELFAQAVACEDGTNVGASAESAGAIAVGPGSFGGPDAEPDPPPAPRPGERRPALDMCDAITAMLLANDIVPEYDGQPLRAMQAGVAVHLRQSLRHVVEEPLPNEMLMRLRQLGGTGEPARY